MIEAIGLEIGIGFGGGYFGAGGILVVAFGESVTDVGFIYLFVLGHRLNHITNFRVIGQIEGLNDFIDLMRQLVIQQVLRLNFNFFH